MLKQRSTRMRNPLPVPASLASSLPIFQCEDERNAITADSALLKTAPFLCRLAAIVHSSNDAIISKSLTGEIQTWNEGAERIYGYSASEVVGKSIAMLYPRGEAGAHLTIFDALRKGHQVKHFEAVRVKKNGDRIRVDLTVSPIRNAAGLIIAASSVARDITDRSRAEQLLRASKEQFRLLFQSNPVSMWVFDRNTFQFLAVNHAAIAQYGYSESEFLRMTIKDIRPPEDVPNLLATMAQQQPGLKKPTRWKHRRKDGCVIDVEIVAHDVDYFGNDGELIAAHDVTERLRSEMLLVEHEMKYHALFNESPDACLLMSSGGFVDCNAAALRMFGFSNPADFTDISAISPAYQEDGTPSQVASDKKVAIAFSKGGESFEWLHQRKNGEVFPAEVRLSALKLSNRDLVITTIRDISDQKRIEEALRFKTALLEAESETTPDGILAVDGNNRILLANRRFAAQFGIPQEILDAKDDVVVLGLVVAQIEDPKAFLQQVDYLNRHHEVSATDEIRLNDGRVFERFSAPLNDGGQYRGRIWYFHDITRRRMAEAAALDAKENYRMLFDNAVVGIFQATLDGRPITVNRALARIHGYETAEQLLDDVSHAGTQLFVNANDLANLTIAAITKRCVQGAEVEVYTKTGARKWIRLNCQAVYDDGGAAQFVNGTAEDVTDRKLAEQRVDSLAYYDSLTGLPNRLLLQDRMDLAVARAEEKGEKLAVLLLDVDRFKLINDSRGRAVGDLVLREIASRLTHCIRERDSVARIGGDEFVILMENAPAVGGVGFAAARIIEELSSPIVIDGHPLQATCSIGIGLYPENGRDRETLIRFADQAMNAAKESGRDTFQFFSTELNTIIQQRTSIESDLRYALERKELFLTYQPQMVIETGKLAGLEALLRWRHPEKGLIPPDVFIGIAESSGLILPIGEWVLWTACHQAKRWLDMGILRTPVAVNISAVQFQQDNFADLAKRVLRETSLPPEFLELELTETLLLSNRDTMLSVLTKLREAGIGLAIDDFGTGYSSLSYLRQFRAQKIKIDRSFIRDVTVNADDAAITAAIIDMAKNLKIRVIAEGVEDEAQLEFLRDHQCDEIQGYLFSKPLTASQIEERLRKANWVVLRHDLTP